MSEISRRDALIAACRANRECDLPRLVLADFLDESGSEADGQRARLIREQCGSEEARNGTCNLDCDCPSCDGERLALGVKSSKLRDGCLVGFDRGFIVGVNATDEWWLANADELVREHDVQRVRLTTLPAVEVVSSNRNRDYHVTLKSATDRVSTVAFSREILSHYPGDPSRAMLLRVLAAHWPGVQFELPPSPIRESLLESQRAILRATQGPLVLQPRSFVYAAVT